MNQRESSGLPLRAMVMVLLFLGVFFVVAYAMKRAFWKDIHWHLLLRQPCNSSGIVISTRRAFAAWCAMPTIPGAGTP